MLDLVMRGFFFVQAEDGIRDLVRSRRLGDVYKRQVTTSSNGLRQIVTACSEGAIAADSIFKFLQQQT